MNKSRIIDVIFICMFSLIISLPFVCAQRKDQGVSESENRTLAKKPELVKENKLNVQYPKEYEEWFLDHLGFRNQLIKANAQIQYHVFGTLLNTSNYHLGRNGDINYADKAILLDYQHLNLYSDIEVKKICDSYQVVSEWLESQDIQFYYVQCYDKHSIYPEQFMGGVNQVEEESKTDAIISRLQTETTVNVISLKDIMINSKGQYETYSNWGDPTHWTQRGAYLGYRYIMDEINKRNHNIFNSLDEDEYVVTTKDMGITLNDIIHEEDLLEEFVIADQDAVALEDKSPMGEFAEDYRHSLCVNPSAENDVKVLIVGDSYINSFIIDDFAETFRETWMIWGDYTEQIPEMLELYHPDMIIYECAERVDRSEQICKLAKRIKAER